MFTKFTVSGHVTIHVMLLMTAGLVAGESMGASAANAAGNNESAAAQQAEADQREVVLSVPGMNCPMCPATVRRALSRVDGVSAAEVDLDAREARVVFDPSRTDVASLIEAVGNAGYSAELKEAEDG